MQETWLLWQARRGDQGAWVALYLRHYRRIFRLAALLLGDDRWAEELTAAAFVTAQRDLARLTTPLSLRLYLCRLVVREAALRGVAGPVAEIEDDTGLLREAIGRLPPGDRVALALTLAAGLSPRLARRAVTGGFPGPGQADVQRSAQQALSELAVRTDWPRASLRRRMARVLQMLEPAPQLWEWATAAAAAPLPPDADVDLRDRAAPVRWAAGVVLAVAVAALAVLRVPAALKPAPAQPRPALVEQERNAPRVVDVTTQMIKNGAVSYSPIEDHAGFRFIVQTPGSPLLPAPIAEELIDAGALADRLPAGMRLPALAGVQDLRLTVFFPTDVFLAWRSGAKTYRFDYHREVLQPIIIAQGQARELQALPGEPAGVAFRDDAGAHAYWYADGNTYHLDTDASLLTVLELIKSL